MFAAIAALVYLAHSYIQPFLVTELLRRQPRVALIPGLAVLLLAYIWLVTLRLSAERAARPLQTEIEEQRRLREIAEAGNRARGEFLAHMSQEIRTPMNAIMGFTDLALKSGISGDLRGYLETVRTSAKWLMHVINDILDFSALEAGSIELTPAEFSVADCIRSTLAMVQAQADEKKLRLKYTVDPRIPARLIGDRERFEQVLVNLADNAVKFTSRGSILISASLESETERELTLRMSIDDTGMGIPAERQHLLFEPFLGWGDSAKHSLSPAREPGVGLAISSKLIELMGGSIHVHSQIGAGSTFSFCVRLKKDDAVLPPSPAANAAQASRSLLIAEDNVVSRRLLTRVLESAGHRVAEAANGEEAVRLFENGKYDAVLMDVGMPEMDGLEAVRRIRAAEKTGQHVPIYATTAHTLPGTRQSCLDAGMDGYISKPLNMDELLKLIAAISSGAPPRNIPTRSLEPPPE
jgi:signal transduction histidine kinase/ActR/RegA family two-component response regulator